MRLKLIGAGVILLASLGMILSKEAEFSEHKRQLEEFGMLLSLLQNEICLLRLPLPLVLEHGNLERAAGGGAQELFARRCGVQAACGVWGGPSHGQRGVEGRAVSRLSGASRQAAGDL